MVNSQLHPRFGTQTWPLSPVQRQFWVISKLHPESVAYHIPFLLRLRGPLDVSALRRSLEAFLQRHDIFRTAIEELDGVPCQYLLPSVKLNFEEIDLRHLSPDEQLTQLRFQTNEMVSRLFDLASPPLLRVALYQLSDQEWQFLLVEHHISIDLRSTSIGENEIEELYEAFTTNRPSRLPPVASQFSDYTKWQLEWVKSARAADMIVAWKNLLEGKIRPPTLPLDHPRGARTSLKGGEIFFKLPPYTDHRVRTFSFDHVLPERYAKASITSSLTAGFALLLARQSGAQDQVIGMAYGNRMETGQLDFRGCAVNSLPIPLTVLETESFIDLAKQVQAVTQRVRSLQQVPHERLVEELKPERNSSFDPLFQVGLEIGIPIQLRLKGIDVKVLPIVNHGAKIDLNLVFQGWQESIHGYLEYNAELFDYQRAKWMVEEYIQILDEGTTRPCAPMRELNGLSRDEKRLQLMEWGRGEQADFPFVSLPEWVAKHAQRAPSSSALSFQDLEINYLELWKHAQTVAIGLIQAGVARGDLVGLYCDRSPEMIYGLLGVLLAGAAYLPLDTEYPAERLAFMVEDSGAQWILTHAALTLRFPHSAAQSLDLDDILLKGAEDFEGVELPVLKPDDRAYVIYTSGSTGKPKGVELLHGGLSALAIAQTERFMTNPNCRVLQFASLNFDASIWEILMAFSAGGSLCIGTREEMLPGSDLLRQLKERKVSIVTLPPSILAALPITSLPDLKTIIVAGEPCPAGLVRQWSPGRSFFNAYGPTETTVCATIGECKDNGEKPSIGIPIYGTYVRLLDKWLRLVPVGAIGELCIGGASLAKGYLNRPDLTSEKFIADPTSKESNARLYRTGDLARWRMDGSLEFIGRQDNQVKIRGFRVELGEIESLLAEHPDVRQAVVLPHAENGGIADQLIAYVVLEARRTLQPSVLRSYLALRMPASVIPSIYVQLEQIPLTPNDKVDRKALAEQPIVKSTQSVADVNQPLSETEQRIATIWQEVLHLDNVSPQVNFFDAGGHSLSLMTVRSKLELEFAKTLDAVVMFQYPTIAGLAQYLSDRVGEGEEEAALDRADIRQQHFSQNQQRQQARLHHRQSNKPQQ